MMIPRRILAPLALLAFLPLAAPAAAQGQDWSRIVTLAPNGAFVLGNPKAPARLIEYFSYTCPHCGHFEAEGAPSLKAQWVRRGLVALEYRNYVRDAFDLSAALLARCGGATRFLGNHEVLFANQQAWLDKAQAFEGSAAPDDRLGAITQIADKTGLFALLAKRGITPAAQRQCLADKQAMAVVLGLTAGANDVADFTGTPFFILNGKPLRDVHAWAQLQPLLPALPRSGK